MKLVQLLLYVSILCSGWIASAKPLTAAKPQETACKTAADSLKVLQINVWQETTQVSGGFKGLVDVIVELQPQVIMLSEVRNYKGIDFQKKLVEALQNRGRQYYTPGAQGRVDVGILTATPITSIAEVFPNHSDHGSILKINTTYKGLDLAVYAAHLDYRNYASNLSRGYDPNSFKKMPKGPVTRLDTIKQINEASRRDEAIRAFIADATEEQAEGHLVLLGGDFNEPSWLDWTVETANRFDHHGVVYEWLSTKLLADAGYKDAYRVLYPSPVTHPGFTWPANNHQADLSKLVWSPTADERDRIDYIFYSPHQRLTLKRAFLVGPQGEIITGKRVDKSYQDPLLTPSAIWPSDHRAVMAVFALQSKSKD